MTYGPAEHAAHRALAAAVMIERLRDLTSGDEAERVAAHVWLDEDESVLGCEAICSLLGLDADRVRAGAMALDPQQLTDALRAAGGLGRAWRR